MSDEDQAPSRKRHRVSKACDPCRRRKERCDGAQPSCQRCVSSSRSCFYNAGRKRGLRPGYVRTLEILLGLILNAFDGVEHLALSMLRNRPEDALSIDNRQWQGHQGTSDVKSLLESWRKSAVLEELQNILDSPESIENEDLFVQSLDGNLTSVFNAIPRQSSHEVRTFNFTDAPAIQYQAEAVPSSSPAQRQCQSQHTQIREQRAECIEPPSETRQSLSLKPPLNWFHLIDVYIADTHNWFPIIQKYTLLRTANLTAIAENNPATQLPKTGELAFLWAVFSYSTHQTAITTPGMNMTQESINHVPNNDIYIQARAMALQEAAKYDLGHVHAHLTLALLEMRREDWPNSWLWIGRAVYTASIIGIIPRDGEKLADDAKRRCFLGCFLLDTLVAAKLGLRPYLQRSDLSSTSSISDDGPEEWESYRPLPGTNTNLEISYGPGRVLSAFNNLCHTSAILGEYSDDSLHPRPLIGDVLSYFAQHDHQLNLSEPQSEITLANDPPHIFLSKLAAAAAYLHLKDASDTAALSLSRQPMHDAIRRNLAQIVDMVNLSPFGASISSSWRLPPTTQIFIQLLRKYNRPDCLPGSRDANSTSAVSGLGTPTPARLIPLPPSSSTARLDSCTTATTVTSNVRLEDYAVEHSPQDDRQEDLRGANFEAHGSYEGLLFPSQAYAPDGAEASVKGFASAALPSLSNHVNEGGTQPLSTVPFDYGANMREITCDNNGSDGLFDQLISLDNSEWPALSGEFMEHLGLSRDGSLFELQNLLAPN